MDWKAFFGSKAFGQVIAIVGILAAILVIFQVGVWVGFRKAAFSFRGGDNFYRQFGGRGGHFAPGLPHGDFPDANGSVGRILKIDLPTFMMMGPDNLEKTVYVRGDTIIRRFRDTLRPEDLRVDEEAVVIGEPNDRGQIEAKLIRLTPPPPPGTMGGPEWPTSDFK